MTCLGGIIAGSISPDALTIGEELASVLSGDVVGIATTLQNLLVGGLEHPLGSSETKWPLAVYVKLALFLVNMLDAFEPASKAAGSNNPAKYARKELAFFEEVRFLFEPASNGQAVDTEEDLLTTLASFLRLIQPDVKPLCDGIVRVAAFVSSLEARLWDEEVLPADRLTASGLEEATRRQ